MKNCEVKSKRSGKLAMVGVVFFSAFMLMVMGIWAVANGRGVSFSLPITLDPLTFLTIQMQMDYNGDGDFEDDGEDDIYTIFDNTASGSVSWAYVSEGAISFAKNSPIKNVSNDTIYKLIFTNKSGANTYLNIFENYDDSFYNKPFTTYPTGGILNLEDDGSSAEMLVHSNPVLTTGLYPLPLKIETLTEPQSNVFTLELDQTGVTSSTPTTFTISNQTSFQTTFTALDNYALPSQVKITCDGTELEKDIDYKWNKETGELNLFARSITGDIDVRIIGVEQGWDNGTIAESFANSGEEGAGTQENPYEIENPSQLAYLGDLVNGGATQSGVYFELTTDVDLNGSEDNQWTPIGNSSYAFQGTFDGNGYTIDGLLINNNLVSQGLIRSNAGTIENVIIGSSSSITARLNLGMVCGYNGETGVIKNCINYSTINFNDTTEDKGHIGGIAGTSYGLIIDCVNYGNICDNGVSGPGAGGIVGRADCNVINCINYGNIGSIDSNSTIGGIIGSFHPDNRYIACINCINYGEVKGTSSIGGIIGGIYGNNYCQVINCYNIGEVNASNTTTHVGSICGYVGYANPIKNCYSLKKVALNKNYDYCGCFGSSANTTNVSDCRELTMGEMQSQDFVDQLNKYVDIIKSIPSTTTDPYELALYSYKDYVKYWTLVGSETGFPIHCD